MVESMMVLQNPTALAVGSCQQIISLEHEDGMMPFRSEGIILGLDCFA
jgi:hypothetical protein